MRRVPVNPETRDAVYCDNCEAVRHMAVAGETLSDKKTVAAEDCCWLCGRPVGDDGQDQNLQAAAANVLAAWDNQSPSSEKWYRLRGKVESLRKALAASTQPPSPQAEDEADETPQWLESNVQEGAKMGRRSGCEESK